MFQSCILWDFHLLQLLLFDAREVVILKKKSSYFYLGARGVVNKAISLKSKGLTGDSHFALCYFFFIFYFFSSCIFIYFFPAPAFFLLFPRVFFLVSHSSAYIRSGLHRRRGREGKEEYRLRGNPNLIHINPNTF
jgi:hypothetical protein